MDEKLAAKIGSAARTARRALNMSQEEAAERIGISAEYYGRIERGAQIPAVENLLRISEELGLSVDALLGRQAGTKAAEPPATYEATESRDLRLLFRRLRRARPRTVRLLSQIVVAIEKPGSRVRGEP